MLKIITEDLFEAEVLKNPRPVLVDFFATWCGPCKMMGGILEELAETDLDFDIIKIDVDEAPDLSEQFGIRSVPTVIRFDGGKETNRRLGAFPKQDILEFMKG